MVQTNNEEIGSLAKPRRVSLKGIISFVALFMKGITIHCKARLGYDASETYRISTRLIRVSLIEDLLSLLLFDWSRIALIVYCHISVNGFSHFYAVI